MKIIEGPRASGKTTEAIEIANEYNAYLVVKSKREARRIYHNDEYPDLDRFPITYSEMMNTKSRNSFLQDFVIDNMDDFVNWATPGHVIAGSVTVKKENQEKSK